MPETLAPLNGLKLIVQEFQKRMRPAGWKDRGAFLVISEIHAEFEKIHYNYIEIFRELLENLLKIDSEGKADRQFWLDIFLEKRKVLEYGRHDLRQKIGALLAEDWPNILKEYVRVVSVYFLYEEDHGSHPSVINNFFVRAMKFTGAGTVGDRYFDTPSMRLAREIIQLEDDSEVASAVSRAINGLSMKRQYVWEVYSRALILSAV